LLAIKAYTIDGWQRFLYDTLSFFCLGLIGFQSTYHPETLSEGFRAGTLPDPVARTAQCREHTLFSMELDSQKQTHRVENLL
jgi:hypothetical protein